MKSCLKLIFFFGCIIFFSGFANSAENLSASVQTSDIKTNKHESIITIDDEEYIVTKINNKLGLHKNGEDEILPVEFEKLEIKVPKNYKKPVIFAVADKISYIFDLKGNILGEETYKKYNVYMHGKVFSYLKSNKDSGVIYENGEIAGVLTKSFGEYEYIKTKKSFCSHLEVVDLIKLFL